MYEKGMENSDLLRVVLNSAFADLVLIASWGDEQYHLSTTNVTFSYPLRALHDAPILHPREQKTRCVHDENCILRPSRDFEMTLPDES